MRRFTVLTATLALILGACSSGPDEESKSTPTDGGSDLRLIAALQPFDACDDLLEHLRAEALERVGPYGLEGTEYRGGPPDLLEGDLAIPTDGAPSFTGGEEADAGAPKAGVDYSETNVQEAGVDEPDIVKTDGERILAIAQSQLHYIDVSGDNPELEGSVELPQGWEHELLVSGDRVLVLANADGGYLEPHDDVIAEDIASPYPLQNATVLVEVDVSDPADMKVVTTLTAEGSYLNARLVDDTARVVVTSQPMGVNFVYPSTSSERGVDIATEANRTVIEQSTVDEWLPSYTIERGDDTKEGRLVECEQVHHPETFSGFGTLSVLSIDLSEPLDLGETVSVLAGGETVYASQESLYVATNQWFDPAVAEDEQQQREIDDSYTTALHKFDISRPGAAEYLASGRVRGHLLNQFAMSEHEDNLRVATTDGTPWGMSEASESFVTVLAQRDRELVQLGQVGDMGRGEQIFSVRFIGDVAYVVTFRQTDPLYTVDLSDPASPTVRGELKILGYSAYLHPVDDGLIIGVGQDATEEGRTLGTQVSLFDVSDLSKPRRLHQLTLGDGSSEAEYDHRAFLYWAATGLTVLPVQSWSYDEGREEYFTGAVGLSIDTESGISEVERITHQSTTIDNGQQSEPPIEPYYEYGAEIRRSLVIGDTLYTLSEQGLKGSDLDTLADEAWVALA